MIYRKEIAMTTLRQLGGKMFLTMTGANKLSYGDEGELNFRFPGSKKWTHCKIALTPSDLYSMTFYKVRGMDVKDKKEISGVYFDMIRDIFTQETGLYTSL